MQENKMVETVFRFVTVRNPKKVAASVEGTQHVVLDKSTEFVNNLESASNEGEVADRNNRLKGEAQKYADNGNLFPDLKKLEESVPIEFLVFSDWLSTHKLTVTISQAKTEIEKVDKMLSPELLEQLWDNLMYYSVIGQANNITQTIQELLRAERFIRRIAEDESLTDEGVKKLANAEIILPKSIFTLPDEVKLELVEDADKPVDTAQLNQEIDEYTAAINELQRYYTRQREIVKNTYEVDNRTGSITEEETVPEDFNGDGKPLTNTAKVELVDDFKGFSQKTQDLLTGIKATPNLSLPFLINELQTEKDKLTRDLYDNADLNQTVLKFGGAVWAKNGNQQSSDIPENLPIKEKADDYDGFILMMDDVVLNR